MDNYYIEKRDDYYQTVFPTELSDYSQIHNTLNDAIAYFEEYGLRWDKIHFVGAILCCPECKGTGIHINPRLKGLWVERCDSCQRFADDEEAQTAVANLIKAQL